MVGPDPAWPGLSAAAPPVTLARRSPCMCTAAQAVRPARLEPHRRTFSVARRCGRHADGHSSRTALPAQALSRRPHQTCSSCLDAMAWCRQFRRHNNLRRKVAAAGMATRCERATGTIAPASRTNQKPPTWARQRRARRGLRVELAGSDPQPNGSARPRQKDLTPCVISCANCRFSQFGPTRRMTMDRTRAHTVAGKTRMPAHDSGAVAATRRLCGSAFVVDAATANVASRYITSVTSTSATSIPRTWSPCV